MIETFLFDSWAVRAYLKQESPADSRVISLLEQAAQGKARLFISIINLCEVYYNVGRLRGEGFARQVLAELQLLPLEILPADEAAVFATARWKMRYPLSYADAFAAAATEQHRATLLTGDSELLSLVGTLKIDALRSG